MKLEGLQVLFTGARSVCSAENALDGARAESRETSQEVRNDGGSDHVAAMEVVEVARGACGQSLATS